MSNRDLMNLPDDLEGNLRALLQTRPPLHIIPASRRAAPKPKPKARKKQAKRRAKAAASDAAAFVGVAHPIAVGVGTMVAVAGICYFGESGFH